MITTTIGSIRRYIREAARAEGHLDSNVKLFESGTDWSHFFALFDCSAGNKLLGGIIIEKSFFNNGGWTVSSVVAKHGYGPLLYRLAMSFASENGGLGIAPNASGNTSPDAQRVWARFKSSNEVIVTWDPDASTDYYKINSNIRDLIDKIDLSPDEENDAKDNVRNLRVVESMTLKDLKRLIRETWGAAASGADPKDAEGFYPYEIERGADIHSFWYRSPARSMGSDGDPGRPADAAEYIGMKPPAPEATGEEGSEAETPEGSEAPPSETTATTSEPADDENLA